MVWHSQYRPTRMPSLDNGQPEDPLVKREIVDVSIPDGDLCTCIVIVILGWSYLFCFRFSVSSLASNDLTEIPSLIHLVHPYALDNLVDAVSHVNALRTMLGSLTASRLKSDIAKEILVDAVDGSGINFVVLEGQLRKIRQLDVFDSLDSELSDIIYIHVFFLLTDMCRRITTALSLFLITLASNSGSALQGVRATYHAFLRL